MTRAIDKVNMARYNLAFAHYMNKDYYDAYVLADHLARRYPQGGLSPKASAIGMQSLIDAYNENTKPDRIADLERFIDLAKYAAKTWNEREEGDDAHLNLGQVYLGRGQYDDSIAEYAAVRDRSPKWNEAQSRLAPPTGPRAGRSNARATRRGRRRGRDRDRDAPEDARRPKEGGRRRRRRGYLPTPPTCAVALTETDKAAEALKLLEPIVKQQQTKSGVGYSPVDGGVPARPDPRRAGRAGHRLDEGHRTGRRRVEPDAALLQARQAAGTRVGTDSREEGRGR